MVFTVAGCATNREKIDVLTADISARNAVEQPLPPNPFKSDGCSLWPDGNWLACCVYHDYQYWLGGSRQERKATDRELRRCVSEKGQRTWGLLMYYGVRIGGVWWLPTRFRWGFGWDYPQTGPPTVPYDSSG